LLFFFGFINFVAEFSLPWLQWSLVFTLYYSSHTSEEQLWWHMTNRDVVRGWYELYLFSFLYIYSSMWTCLASSCEVYVIEWLLCSSCSHMISSNLLIVCSMSCRCLLALFYS
jgi:hypothetical protein